MFEQSDQQFEELTKLRDRRRRRLFRVLAAGGPSVVGLAVIWWILIVQERLIVDPKTGRLKFQKAPLYLEEKGHDVTGHRYLYDAHLGWKNIPYWESKTFGRYLKINSLGLRDREHPYEKPAGVQRVLVLGDSFAWGYGVSNRETFSSQLEKRFESENMPWEVLNAGVSGWGTDQELLYLQRDGLRFSPDIVVVAFFLGNDPENNSTSKKYGLQKPWFPDLDLMLSNVPVPLPGSSKKPESTKVDPIELSAAILTRMGEVCESHGCPLIVMKFGEYLGFDPRNAEDWAAETRQLKSLLPEGVHFFDWDQQLEARSISGYDVIEGNDEGHWNAFGHELTAEFLFEFLEPHTRSKP